MFEQTVLNCVVLAMPDSLLSKNDRSFPRQAQDNEIEKKNTQTKLTRNEWLLLLFSPQDEKEVAKGSRG
jgi:hypothetical protein